ncbi:uncharacterized protein LOC129321082 isoform X2 [Prosopis cineraria]|uniref:uncharacterized protein LOC129321082 isoform X2 n=1 Tax=Prosopis cineraria TaxID=364024 RepID=UPI00240FA98C|nr:uncharacterized protein LOC129321082 isoform X2 [Prosopis cineraria]
MKRRTQKRPRYSSYFLLYAKRFNFSILLLKSIGLQTLLLSATYHPMVGESPSSSAVLAMDGLDDVENYVWAHEQEGLAWDTYHHIFELVHNGNMSFRENRLEEAINFYSRANSIKPGDPVILHNRCAAYLRISRFLKDRSPSASEYKPLSGLDPTIHAELGLKDAEKLVDLRSNSVKSYLLKANALFLLEKYEKARDAILSGLQVDPFSESLQAGLRSLEKGSASLMGMNRHEEQPGTSTHGQPERTDDFDCTVCLKLLYEPVTTPCGHSFCHSCLFQSMDHGNRCPLCRTVLLISPRTCSISVTLKNIIQKNFPEEYAKRKQEHDSLTNFGVDLIPLFVMDVVMPCQKFPLNIFEPRYRLMAIIDSTTGSLAEYACEVEITECEPLPDGRFYIEIESCRRFRIIRSQDQDGYRVAEVEWIHDIMPPEGSRERQSLQELTYDAAETARSWIRRAKEAARAKQDHRRLERIQSVELTMPSQRDPERFSFWLASLSKLRPQERLDLMGLRNTGERVRRGLNYLGAEEQRCRIQ